MIVNYFYIADEIHGRPISAIPTRAEIKRLPDQGLKDLYHPAKMSHKYPYSFIDITLENPIDEIDKNEEALRLTQLLDIPQDIIEEIITDQRPRADSYPDFFLILFKCLTVTKEEPQIKLLEHQVGVIIRDNIIFSIHKKIPSMPVSSVFKRFNKYPTKIARGGITFFVSAYLDVMIDQVYDVLEVWTKQIDKYEKQIVKKPSKTLLFGILEMRHHLLDLVKILQADREIINNIRSGSEKIFSVDDIPPELDDHIKHLLDESDIIRTLLTDVSNMYYNSDSARLNETMKRFTFITSLILLPSLIGGIFGMNFISSTGTVMWQFYVVIAGMIISVVALFLFFKLKKLI
jgi:magnesium transporter